MTKERPAGSGRNPTAIRVAHHERCFVTGAFSLERVFDAVRSALPEEIHAAVHRSPFPSRGVIPRLRNMASAAAVRADIHHIVGDVHYLAPMFVARRLVLTIADCTTLQRRRGLRRGMLWFWWYWLPVRLAGVVTAISVATARELESFGVCPVAAVRVVHCPLPAGFAPCPRSEVGTRPRLLLVGTSVNKNFERTVAAVADLGCELCIVGNLTQDQERLLGGTGVPYQAQANLDGATLAAAYRECDIVVFASTYEGFGLPIIEAQATGRPVVTSRAEPMMEVAGDGACPVDPLDVASIRAGVRKVIRERPYRERLIEAGLANVQRFAPARIAAQYAAIYREVALGPVAAGS